MEANTLRIGNYLQYKNTQDIAIVELIHKKHFDCRDEFGFFTPNANYESIPISEDFLIKLGFVECEGKFGTYYKCSKLDGFRIWLHEDENVTLWQVGRKEYDNDTTTFISADLKFIHRLQNLYNILTGEELTIKD